MDSRKDIHITLRFRNNIILDACKKKFGHTSMARLSNELGIGYQALLDLLSFRKSPVCIRKKTRYTHVPAFEGTYWRSIATKLSTAFGLSPFTVFPEHLWRERQSKFELTVDSQEMLGFSEVRSLPDPKLNPEEQAILNGECKSILNALDTLTPREGEVLKARFGINEEEKTLKQVGKDCHITPERVRQIEIKALRKLRHPRRTRILDGR